jgi:hypothetical protein
MCRFSDGFGSGVPVSDVRLACPETTSEWSSVGVAITGGGDGTAGNGGGDEDASASSQRTAFGATIMAATRAIERRLARVNATTLSGALDGSGEHQPPPRVVHTQAQGGTVAHLFLVSATTDTDTSSPVEAIGVVDTSATSGRPHTAMYMRELLLNPDAWCGRQPGGGGGGGDGEGLTGTTGKQRRGRGGDRRLLRGGRRGQHEAFEIFADNGPTGQIRFLAPSADPGMQSRGGATVHVEKPITGNPAMEYCVMTVAAPSAVRASLSAASSLPPVSPEHRPGQDLKRVGFSLTAAQATLHGALTAKRMLQGVAIEVVKLPPKNGGGGRGGGAGGGRGGGRGGRGGRGGGRGGGKNRGPVSGASSSSDGTKKAPPPTSQPRAPGSSSAATAAVATPLVSASAQPPPTGTYVVGYAAEYGENSRQMLRCDSVWCCGVLLVLVRGTCALLSC